VSALLDGTLREQAAAVAGGDVDIDFVYEHVSART